MGASSVGNKSICLPAPSEVAYEALVVDTDAFRSYLEQQAAEQPEIFTAQMEAGFWFHDFVTSGKLNLKMRRKSLVKTGEVYQLRPDFVMPYMVGKTQEMEKALYLRRFAVPFDALAYVFRRNGMYWYRACLSLGRPSLVGTTVKDSTLLPAHLVAYEKHTWWLGERVYIPTTVAGGCILGVGLTESASAEALTQGYQNFETEAHQLDPNYAPLTVNTDGWQPTQQAWQRLFPSVTLIFCFLHAVLKIQDSC